MGYLAAWRSRDDDEFVLRMGEIKQDLIKRVYDRWGDLVVDRLTQRFGNPMVLDDIDRTIPIVDAFALEHRLPDGRTPAEVHADEAPGLDEEERATLRGWSHVIDSVFEIAGRDGRRLDLVDLAGAGGRSMAVRPNMIFANDPFRPGWLLKARLVSVRDFYTFSGTLERMPPDERERVLRDLRRAGRLPPAPNPRRWLPPPGTPPSDPRGPCPCGSGRKYRKCCMRR